MRPLQNWHKWLMLPLLGLALSARPIGCDYSSITEKFGTEAVAHCYEKCPFQNRTGDGHFDLNCGSDCSIQQCSLGCSLWKQGLDRTCQITCNLTSETVVSQELYCVMGCNEALNTYFQKLRDLIGIPPAPALVADSLTATSLSLLWEGPNLANLSYLVQWRYEELAGNWQFYSNNSRADRSVIHVDSLRPYTKYRFRIAVFLSGRGGSVEPVYSAPSVVMSTSESGKPSSAPVALRAAAPDPSRVAISWEPGPFPNGPLISYVLRLADTQLNSYAVLEDMPASNNTLFYMFQNLDPAREYEVSVAMRNSVGEGPRAEVKISTPPLPTEVPSQQPILILGGEKNILAAQANDMLSDPTELYSTEHNITGVGLDISRDYLFVSISNGYVYRSSLSEKSQSIPILTPDTITYKPLDLSVDWLNKHLYVLGEVYYTKEGSTNNNTMYSNWEILRCDFDGKNQLVALAGFNSRPIHFEVDPFNGYLFWALRGPERGGLYRLDLAAVSNGARHDAPPERLLPDAHLAAFTLDHADFRLLVAHRRRNTVLAVSLDGREINDLRRNTQTPMFGSARSMAFAGGLFYWTNGKEMLTEEYHAQTDSYFHNEYPVVFNTKRIATRQVLVAVRSSQPVPVPVNPPTGVQSVLGASRAKVAWSPPHLLGHQGSGAWQHWAFHLQLTHVPTGDVIERKGINTTTYTVENLKEDAEYIVKVAAATESGSGPWSSEFIGKTLSSSPATLRSTLLWSGPEGLLQTNLTGDNLQTLIHRSHLKFLQITDISWYRDKLYLVTNASTVLWYNTSTHEKGVMTNMDNVGSLAVDWVGKRIYWSNPKQQLITRGNLEGGNREPVPIVTVAKELIIDSLAAYIYWNTGHAVEAARLNGDNKMVYYPAQLFSGKQVMGITADLEKKWLYWLVRSYDGSELHRAPTADRITTDNYEVSKSLVSRLPRQSTLGPMCYFSGRLVWVKDSSLAEVSDLSGRYTANMIPGVHIITVRDPTLHALSENIVAIPTMVDQSSIKVTGVWDNFNVTWAPVANVNHGRVFYDVSIQIEGNHKIEATVERPPVALLGRAAPHSALQVRVRAQSQWGAAAAASAALRSPPAPPASPRRARLYVQTRHNREARPSATFRWDPPHQANGIILGYETQCWVTPAGATSATAAVRPADCAGKRLPPDLTELTVKNLISNTTYYFQVRAYTEAGFGFYSEVVSTFSQEVNPIPRILMSSQDFIKVLDLDNGESETIHKIIGMPVDFGVSIQENVIYWANNLEEIFSSQITGDGHYKLTSTNGSAQAVGVDWVSRSAFWAQPEGVYRARALSAPQRGRPRLQRLFFSRRPVRSLALSPLTKTLYWYEEGDHQGFGTIMMTRIDIINIKTFFNHTDENARGKCNCPENPQVGRSFVIDMTGSEEKLIWIDPWVHRIVASDMNGCHCRVVVDASHEPKYGFPPISITVDSKYVYWFNSTEKYVYYKDKNRDSKVNQIKTSHGSKIVALDVANQPYPPKQCLIPHSMRSEPQVITNSANSITLEIPIVENKKLCSDFETAATEYTIYYQMQSSKVTSGNNEMQFVATVDHEVVLSNLNTFTNYTVHVEATNFYAKKFEMSPLKSAALLVQTAAEAPKAARDVTATVLSPVLARVEWTTQPDLWYQLYWATNESNHFQHKFQEHNTFPVSEGRAANMSHLSPNTSYVVWVRACSNYSKVYTDSKQISVQTYPLPPVLELHNCTAYSIYVRWNPPTTYTLVQYKVEYSEVGGNAWHACASVGGAWTAWTAGKLRPRTRYRFRLQLLYAAAAPRYFWPHDDRFVFETLGDVPGAPGAPRGDVLAERVLRAWWPEPAAHGHPVHAYRVWGRPAHRVQKTSGNITNNGSKQFHQELPDDIDDDFKKLILQEGLSLLHNGTENYWLLRSETLSRVEAAGAWLVCAQAANKLGWGPLGPCAPLQVPPEPRGRAPSGAPAAAALLVAVAALAAGALAVAAGLLYMYKNRLKKKTAMQNQAPVNITPRGPDVELATLRQLPTTRHSTNILYNQGIQVGCPTDAELAALPHIRRDNITLSKFLGSGAFGEVFEGIARQLPGETAPTKVAVKTLRKGATEQEKNEFLKEAALMSNFKHEHILRLLGVCLDNDPNYIIMELMEEGDLLSYLRSKRTLLYTSSSLTLLELIDICVDVTRGCRYLQEMHFVHRDLAARNCLVAKSAASGRRIVKIGDFGLARDIYKNDYYRKEGEGLLPVRWMAAECLVDGVFSSQSDVWAWGVLCWEVLSLGQQPYPARSNRDVLLYVRAGGCPSRPPNCPAALHALLRRCWSPRPELRPSFAACLAELLALRLALRLALAEPEPSYLTIIPDDVAVDNRTYLLDENDNACLDEDMMEEQMEPSRLLPERPSVYPIAYGDVDGYEVPRARHSFADVWPPAPGPLLRTHSLRGPRPRAGGPSATITPIRKRASYCEARARSRDTFNTSF